MSPSARVTTWCLVVAAMAAALGCASRSRVLVPPRVDLADYGAIGIIEFSASSDPEYGPLATIQFIQMLQDAQPGAPILELGTQEQVLAKVGRQELDFEAMRAIGAAYRVDAVFSGDVEVSEVKPNVRFNRSLTSMNASADINGQLRARLVETGAGATVWSKRATSSANMAHVGIPGRGAIPSFGATAQGDVETGLVGQLVANLSHDFSPRWVTE